MGKILRNLAAIGGHLVDLVASADSAITKAGADALTNFLAYIATAKLGKVDLESWQSGLRPHVVAGAKTRWPNENTAKQRVSEIKAATIAYTNGFKPLAGENLQAYARRARVANGEKGLTPKVKSRGTKGNKKGGKAKGGKVTMEVTRQAALSLLAKKNERDMKVIDFCVTSKMVTLREIYDNATKAQNV